VAGRSLSRPLERQFFVRRGQELWGAALNRAWPVQRSASLDELTKDLDPAADRTVPKVRAKQK
jgi:hypothetical protein